MDLTNSAVKTPEAETQSPTWIQPTKASPFSNGVLKRHAPLHLHHPVVVVYKECLKNHAATLGGHAVDGCGEFMPSPASNPADPTSLKCAACGCHRNFHRREPEDPLLFLPAPPGAAPALEYRPHHRHHPSPPHQLGDTSGSPNDSPSPPPISSSYYPSAPHMLLALSHGVSGPPPDRCPPISTAINTTIPTPPVNSNSRKRFRTKFTQDQKDKMLELAERIGWKMQKRDEDVISEFCSEIGVDRGVFKVWMHNNKNTVGKKDHQLDLSNSNIALSSPPPAAAGAAAEGHCHHYHGKEIERKENVHGLEMRNLHLQDSSSSRVLGTNGSSSSP